MARRKRIKRNKPFISSGYNPLAQGKSREEVMAGIDEFYKRYQYSKDILKISIDRDKEFKYMREGNRDNYVNEIFERYNLLRNPDTKRPFTDIQEYGNYLRKNTPYTNEQIEYLWKDYNKIKGLVYTGQYEDYRINAFRDSYINAMKQSGLSKEAMDNLENLSIEQFANLANMRNADKSKERKWRLPELGGFNYHIQDTEAMKDYATNAEKEIRELFKEMGLEWKEYDYRQVDFTEINKRRASHYKSYSADVRKAIRVINRTYNTVTNRVDESKYGENEVGNVEFLERTVKSMSRTTSKNNQVIRKSKKGEYYIPFVGSTRKGTKNRNLLLDIVDLLDLEYKD